MIKRNKFTPKKIGLSAWGVLTLFTLLVFIVGTRHFTDGALVLMWCFFSWNFYAYAFDRGMWPRVFIELDGHGRGLPAWRSFMFWLSAVFYTALLAAIAFSDGQ